MKQGTLGRWQRRKQESVSPPRQQQLAGSVWCGYFGALEPVEGLRRLGKTWTRKLAFNFHQCQLFARKELYHPSSSATWKADVHTFMEHVGTMVGQRKLSSKYLGPRCRFLLVTSVQRGGWHCCCTYPFVASISTLQLKWLPRYLKGRHPIHPPSFLFFYFIFLPFPFWQPDVRD